MVALGAVTEAHALIFLLVLVRMTGLFVIAPVFAHQSVPNQVKPWFALACSLVAYPAVVGGGGAPGASALASQLPPGVIGLAAAICGELFVGAVIGYLALLVFAAAQYAGELIDTQIGFGMANLVDPSFGGNITVLGQIHFLLATMLYLAIDGHHLLVGAVMTSFELAPVGQVTVGTALAGLVIERFTLLFTMALRISLPAVSCLFITELGLGLIARAVPQMNVLMVGFPLKIGVGLVVLGTAMSATATYLVAIMRQLGDVISQAIAVLRL